MHSFESAIHRSNGRIIKYETEKSSQKKGESLYDSVKYNPLKNLIYYFIIVNEILYIFII